MFKSNSANEILNWVEQYAMENCHFSVQISAENGEAIELLKFIGDRTDGQS